MQRHKHPQRTDSFPVVFSLEAVGTLVHDVIDAVGVELAGLLRVGDVDGKKCSVMDAVYTNRAEKMGGKTHSYDFPGETEYEQSELVMNLGSFEKIDVVKGEDE